MLKRMLLVMGVVPYSDFVSGDSVASQKTTATPEDILENLFDHGSWLEYDRETFCSAKFIQTSPNRRADYSSLTNPGWNRPKASALGFVTKSSCSRPRMSRSTQYLKEEKTFYLCRAPHRRVPFPRHPPQRQDH